MNFDVGRQNRILCLPPRPLVKPYFLAAWRPTHCNLLGLLASDQHASGFTSLGPSIIYHLYCPFCCTSLTLLLIWDFDFSLPLLCLLRGWTRSLFHSGELWRLEGVPDLPSSLSPLSPPTCSSSTHQEMTMIHFSVSECVSNVLARKYGSEVCQFESKSL